MPTPIRFSSRAVVRPVNPGNAAVCVACGERVKFTARERALQVIANVYVEGVWDRVEHYHLRCYEDHERPHGPAIPT